MKRKGVSYDVGRVMGFNWRPDFDPKIVRRELEIIKNDLNCNAVRICGRNINRLIEASKYALEQGLEVWLSPEMWDKSPQQTISYITKAAKAAETLRQHWPDRLVFSVGSELTLFMRGIVEGRNITARIKNPTFISRVKAGEHNKPLNEFLSKAADSVRKEFHGKLTYASLIWEGVDWELFDFVGVDHYRIERIKDQYLQMLKPVFNHRKPVVITEFGYKTCQGGLGSEGFLSSSGLGGNIIDLKSQFLHQIPLIGRFVKPHLNGNHVRDENWQASQIVDNLKVLNDAGVDGAFIFQFISQITPYSENPKYDLDMASSSLIKYYDDGKHGTTYQDMTWEPKESFKAVADYYKSG
ncbi:MAG: abortive infection protein [Candidatus Bathyarchaeia archaeon]|jgi:hypothetical protein